MRYYDEGNFFTDIICAVPVSLIAFLVPGLDVSYLMLFRILKLNAFECTILDLRKSRNYRLRSIGIYANDLYEMYVVRCSRMLERNLIISLKYHCITHSCHYTSFYSSNVTKYSTRARTQVLEHRHACSDCDLGIHDYSSQRMYLSVHRNALLTFLDGDVRAGLCE